MSMRFSVAVLLAGVALLSGCEKEQPPPVAPEIKPTAPVGLPPSTSTVPQGDQDFAMKAASAGLAEVEASRSIVEKTTSDTVREFSRRMVDEHGAANEELLRI